MAGDGARPNDRGRPEGGKPGRPDRGRPGRGANERGRPERGGTERGRPERRGTERGRPERGEAGTRPDRRADPRPGREGEEREFTRVAPPYRPQAPRPVQPPLPEDTPRLPRDVYRDLKAAAAPTTLGDVSKAYAAAGDALADGDSDRAVALLKWAKAVASRSAAVREGLGVALYTAGEFAAAHSELLAYRRLSDRHDQNHLIADCARAIGRTEKVAEHIDALLAAPEVDASRKAEGLIVLAGTYADRGDLRGAYAVLERSGLDPAEVPQWQPRVWYAAADLAERMGEHDRARELFEAIMTFDEDFFDVRARLAALS